MTGRGSVGREYGPHLQTTDGEEQHDADSFRARDVEVAQRGDGDEDDGEVGEDVESGGDVVVQSVVDAGALFKGWVPELARRVAGEDADDETLQSVGDDEDYAGPNGTDCADRDKDAEVLREDG